MHPRGGFFANPFPFFDRGSEPSRTFLGAAFEELLDHILFVTGTGGVHPIAAVFQFVTLVKQQSGIAAVIDEQLRAEATGMR